MTTIVEPNLTVNAEKEDKTDKEIEEEIEGRRINPAESAKKGNTMDLTMD